MSANPRMLCPRLLCGGLGWVLMLSMTSGCSSTAGRNGPVIEPEELAHQLNGAAPRNMVLLDVRGEDAYARQHVAGAVRVDAAVWKKRSFAPETGLDKETYWHDRVGALGISGREPVVLYDDGDMTDAARLWFILQHVGVPRVAVLNGGYPALQPFIADGAVPVSQTPTRPEPVAFKPKGTTATHVAIADRTDVLRAAQDHRTGILDARTPAEYQGEELKDNPRGGHVPRAVNIPHRELLDDNGRLKSPEALAEIFRHAGFKHGEPIITYCQSGGRASLAALAATRAGYGPVLNYYYSFGDWAAHASCPVVRAEQ